jgi:hypothetical protein
MYMEAHFIGGLAKLSVTKFGSSYAQGIGASVQGAKNLHAMLAARALAKLGGFMEGELSTPYNQEATAVLRGLLTPRVATQLKDRSPRELLRNLTSNLETPHVSSISIFESTFILKERYIDRVTYVIREMEAVTCTV